MLLILLENLADLSAYSCNSRASSQAFELTSVTYVSFFVHILKTPRYLHVCQGLFRRTIRFIHRYSCNSRASSQAFVLLSVTYVPFFVHILKTPRYLHVVSSAAAFVLSTGTAATLAGKVRNSRALTGATLAQDSGNSAVVYEGIGKRVWLCVAGNASELACLSASHCRSLRL